MSMRIRWPTAALVLGVCVAGVVFVWWIAANSVSPEQAAADASPPPAAVATARVERRVVADIVAVRADVVPASAIEISATVGSDVARLSVVTDVFVRPGDRVESGDALVALSDRPIIALHGDVPLYRDLDRGSTGRDVERLQAGLRSAGATIPADETGTVGDDTIKAVTALYEPLGYDVPSPPILVGELRLLPDLPATVTSSQVDRGQVAEGVLLTVAGDERLLRAELPGEQSSLFDIGMQVLQDGSAVARVVDVMQTDGQTMVLMDPADEAMSVSLGESLAVNIVRAATETAVLAVPVTAVRTDGSGTTFVVPVDDDPVEVALGVIRGGWAEIREVEPGRELAAGTPVVLA